MSQRLPWAAFLIVSVLVAGKKSYYETLEVDKDASNADIKKTYRRLALKWHPDRNKEPEATERFRELAEAYEVLGDPERRRQYDAGQGNLDFDFHFSDAGDVFRQFFGDEDPFANFDKIFADMEREATASFKVEFGGGGGFFSSFSSFFSSVTSSFSAGEAGNAKVQHKSVETKVDADGRRSSKTVESDGVETKVTLEESVVGATTTPPPASLEDPSLEELHGEGLESAEERRVAENEAPGAAEPSSSSGSRASEPAVPSPEAAAALDPADAGPTCGSGSTCPSGAPGGAAADPCESLRSTQGMEPVDSAVRHVLGSACCNAAPQQAATSREGCCRRCLASADCELFVFQPSAGGCWLLRWKGAEKPTRPAADRIMAERGGL